MALSKHLKTVRGQSMYCSYIQWTRGLHSRNSVELLGIYYSKLQKSNNVHTQTSHIL